MRAGDYLVNLPELQREYYFMKIGFICPNLSGHLNPMTALARPSSGAHHKVVFLYSTEANGLPFIPGSEKDHINKNGTEAKHAAWRTPRDPGSAGPHQYAKGKRNGNPESDV